MKRIHLLPQDDNTNGWSKLAGPRTASAALRASVRADWVVVAQASQGSPPLIGWPKIVLMTKLY